MRFIQVNGNSMSPTINNGQILLVKQIFSYELNDIVCLKFQGKLIVKRVVGLSNNMVEIKENNVYCQRNLIFRYLSENSQNLLLEVPPDHIAVIGDNPNNSLDSRKIGPINILQIVGKVIFRIWPPKKF